MRQDSGERSMVLGSSFNNYIKHMLGRLRINKKKKNTDTS